MVVTHALVCLHWWSLPASSDKLHNSSPHTVLSGSRILYLEATKDTNDPTTCFSIPVTIIYCRKQIKIIMANINITLHWWKKHSHSLYRDHITFGHNFTYHSSCHFYLMVDNHAYWDGEAKNTFRTMSTKHRSYQWTTAKQWLIIKHASSDNCDISACHHKVRRAYLYSGIF